MTTLAIDLFDARLRHTYGDYYRSRSETNRGMRIDFVLCSPALSKRVTGAFIDREERLDESKPGPSDHAPVASRTRPAPPEPN